MSISTDFKPFVSATTAPAEFTLKAVLLGIVLGLLFGVASIYLGLKIGLTVSASIPVAVLSISIFKRLGSSTILENNMVQTVASAGESLAAGITFTMPAILMLGFDLEYGKTILLASIGGIIGILFMIPLRRLLIVQEHGTLAYPEGTACADVLIAGETGGNMATLVFSGLGFGIVYKILMSVLGLWKDTPEFKITGYQNALVSAEITPELLGVGYIIGPRVAAIMAAGGVMAWLCIMPLISFFGQNGLLAIAPSKLSIAEMGMWDIWKNYTRYIGGGAVVFSGITCLVKTLPTIWRTFRQSLDELLHSKLSSANKARTDRDFPVALTLIGAIALVFVIAASPILPSGMGATSLVSALLIIIFGFFFCTVSARICGLVGSSSNPVSGMTITTLMITCVIFLAMGWTGLTFAATAIGVGAVVCIALANAGTTSQDLKTGFLVGATPRSQQLGLVIGTLISAAVMGAVMIALHKAGAEHGAGIGSAALPAPKGQLMALIVQGVLEQNLPWSLILFGAAISLTVELLGVESLAFAVGLYLPMSTSLPIFCGGAVHWVIKRFHSATRDEDSSPGTLYSAGLIGGGAIMGIVTAFGQGFWPKTFESLNLGTHLGLGNTAIAPWGDIGATIMFGLMIAMLYRTASRKN